MNLDGFINPRRRVGNRWHKEENPVMRISCSGISFNRRCCEFLGLPDKVDLLINEEKRQLALVPGSWISFKTSRATFGEKKLCRLVEDIAGLVTREKSYTDKGQLIDVICRTYSSRGAYVEEANAILFDLRKEAFEIERER